MTSTDAPEYGSAAFYEVVGRVLLALHDTYKPGPLAAAQDLRHQVSLDNGLDLFWTGGPHGWEVAEALLELAENEEMYSGLGPGDVTIVRTGREGYAHLLVRGLRVRLRADETIGHTEAVVREMAARRVMHPA